MIGEWRSDRPWWRQPLIIRVSWGFALPLGYGVCWRDVQRHEKVAAVLPLSYILAVAHWAYWEARVPWFAYRSQDLAMRFRRSIKENKP